MTDFTKDLATFISADTEAKLQRKLRELSLTTGKKPEIISIYPKGSSVICWFFLDAQRFGVGVEEAPVEKAPTKKKKVRKKKA